MLGRTRPFVALAIVLVALVVHSPTAHAQNPYGIVLHVTEADFAQGCALVDESSFVCSDANVVGDGSQMQFVLAVAYGWREIPGWGGPDVGLGAVAFALSYPPQTTITLWQSCDGTLASPLSDKLIGEWPESDTGLALAFTEDGGANPASGFVTLGYALVDAGSSGIMSVTRFAAAPIDAVQFVSSTALTFDIPETGFSSVDVGGDDPGGALRTCEGTIPVQEVSWGAIKSAF